MVSASYSFHSSFMFYLFFFFRKKELSWNLDFLVVCLDVVWRWSGWVLKVDGCLGSTVCSTSVFKTRLANISCFISNASREKNVIHLFFFRKRFCNLHLEKHFIKNKMNKRCSMSLADSSKEHGHHVKNTLSTCLNSSPRCLLRRAKSDTQIDVMQIQKILMQSVVGP